MAPKQDEKQRPILMVLTTSTANTEDLPSATPPPKIDVAVPMTEIEVPNTKVSYPSSSRNNTKQPVEKTTEKVFHTPINDDRHVTKGCGVDATINEEYDIPAFDDVLDMDLLCGSRGLPYPFYNEQPGITEAQTQPFVDTENDKANATTVALTTKTVYTFDLAVKFSSVQEDKAEVPKYSTEAIDAPFLPIN